MQMLVDDLIWFWWPWALSLFSSQWKSKRTSWQRGWVSRSWEFQEGRWWQLCRPVGMSVDLGNIQSGTLVSVLSQMFALSFILAIFIFCNCVLFFCLPYQSVNFSRTRIVVVSFLSATLFLTFFCPRKNSLRLLMCFVEYFRTY